MQAKHARDLVEAAVPAERGDAPEEFLCSISCDIMDDPVVAADNRTYEHKPIHSSFSKLFNRKEQENENERLRMIYTKPRWRVTLAEAAKWVIGKFQSALDGEFEDTSWPRANPFGFGLMRIRTKFGPELKVWDAKQRKLGPDGADDGSVDDDGDSDEEEDDDDEEEDDEEEDDDDADALMGQVAQEEV